MGGAANKEKSKKPYQKPSWEKKAMFEKFALGCGKDPGSKAPKCRAGNKFT